MVPVVDHTMADRIVDAVTRGFRISKGFIADKKIKILYSSFGCKMAWFTRNGRSTRGCRSRSTGRNCSRENTFLISQLDVESVMASGRTYNEGSEFPAKLEEFNVCCKVDLRFKRIRTLLLSIQYHYRI
jgi:hypothetical protein